MPMARFMFFVFVAFAVYQPGKFSPSNMITLFIRCKIFDRVRVRVRFNVQIKYSNSMIFKNSLSAS